MEGDGDGSATQEDIRIVTERGEEVLGSWGNTVVTDERGEADTKEDDNETQTERDRETQLDTETPPGVTIVESTQQPDILLKTSRKRTRRGRYRSLDLELLNSSKVGEITNTNTDTSGEVVGEEKDERKQKKRRTSSTRKSRLTTSTRSLDNRSSSGEESRERRR